MDKNQIKKAIERAIKTKSKATMISTLRQSARSAFLQGDKHLALSLIQFAIDFSEQTNQYFLLISDFHYYKTGEKLSTDHPKFDAPTPSLEEPWEKVRTFIRNL